MKELYLVCNAHIDPIWLWQWQEGATAAIATFRSAADFCEEYDGFVFCHNEALLYQWTQEYDPALFARIQKLVKQGKWQIMGGWYLQPDCNMPSGESMLRQILSGRSYFKKEFDAEPKIAVNFDSFGHSRGLVQILSQCGYEGYLYMRPEASRMTLPSRNFTWRGFDGSEVLARRLDQGYSSLMGQAEKDVRQWAEDAKDENVSVFTWGVGNHGGGPSRVDLNALEAWMQSRTDIKIQHATPEMFFEALQKDQTDFPVVEEDLRPVFVGCYASQLRVKQLHRRLENELFATEKLLSAASECGLLAYPAEELEEAQRDLMLSEFHDALPGTSIESGTEGTKITLYHGLEIVEKLRLRGFMAMLSGQPKAEPGTVPVFVYNPHPYPVTDVFVCEFMPADQNWSRTVRNTVTVYRDGKEIPSQEEKPEVNMNLDWRKRIVFTATLEPSAMNRFDCVITQKPCEAAEPAPQGETIEFANDRMQVTINTKTGLIDRYCVDGVSYVKAGSFSTTLFQDNPDPWHMDGHRYGGVLGSFAPVPARTAPRYADGTETVVPAVRIVEDGPVRMVVEAEFEWNRSKLIQTYRLPRQGCAFEIEQRLYWNERDMIAKLAVPCAVSGDYLGQGMFGCGPLPMDGTECVSQKWCGVFGEHHALTVANTGTYGSHFQDGSIYLSIVRGASYAAHPIEDRPLVSQERFIAPMDQGEHVLLFQICGGDVQARRSGIDAEAQILNEAPYALNAFPGGEGKKPQSFLKIDKKEILVSAMYRKEKNGDLILRLWNSTPEECTAQVELPSMEIRQTLTFPPFRFQTYVVKGEGGLTPVGPVEAEM